MGVSFKRFCKNGSCPKLDGETSAPLLKLGQGGTVQSAQLRAANGDRSYFPLGDLSQYHSWFDRLTTNGIARWRPQAPTGSPWAVETLRVDCDTACDRQNL